MQCRVLVRREEIPVRLLVGVDVDRPRVRDDPVGHARGVDVLVPRREVAVGVESEGRRPHVLVTTVGVRHRHQEVVKPVQALHVRAVRARRQLIEDSADRLAGRRLVPVRGRGVPDERRAVLCLRSALLGRDRAFAHAAPERAVVAARVEVGDVVRGSDHVVAELLAEVRVAEIAPDDAHPGVGRSGRHDGVEVAV